MDAKQIEDELVKTFSDAVVKAVDLTGGGDHWQVTIKTAAFAGKSLVEQHQMVYKVLGKWVNNRDIHALALNTSAG